MVWNQHWMNILRNSNRLALVKSSVIVAYAAIHRTASASSEMDTGIHQYDEETRHCGECRNPSHG